MERFPVRRSPAEWALQCYGSARGLRRLSGMSTMEQVKENLQFADASRIQGFGEAEQQLIAEPGNCIGPGS